MTIKLDTMYRIDAPGHTYHERIVRAIATFGIGLGLQGALVVCVSDGQRLTVCTSKLRYVGPCQVVGPSEELSG